MCMNSRRLLGILAFLSPAVSLGQVPRIETPALVQTRQVERRTPLGPGEPVRFSARDAYAANLSMFRRAIEGAGFRPNQTDPARVACVGIGSWTDTVDPDTVLVAILREAYGTAIRPASACGWVPPDSTDVHRYIAETATKRPGVMIWVGVPRAHSDGSYSMWLGYYSGFGHVAMYQCRLERSPRGPEVVRCEVRGIA